MSELLLLALLTAAVGCGWVLGVWQSKVASKKYQKKGNALFEGVNYALNEIPDHALEAFLQVVDVDSDTLETHLALGAIHRRRGELDKAIRIHENLMERSELSPAQKALARFELAQDFMKSGLLDRAEEHLQVLAERSKAYRSTALYTLIDIYQDEQEWQKAVNAATALEGMVDQEDRQRLDHLRSHFYCEIADAALLNKDYIGVRRAIRNAEQYFAENERTQMLRGNLERSLDNPLEAARIAEALLIRGTELLSESLHLVYSAYEDMQDRPGYLESLQRIHEVNPDLVILQTLAKVYIEEEQESKAVQLLLGSMNKQPNLGVLSMLIGLDSVEKIDFQQSWKKLLSESQGYELSSYQCQHCGFETHKHHWRCPGCRRWETIRNSSRLLEGANHAEM